MDDPAGTRQRAWLRSWVREESFWRDVTARTFSGLLVVAVTFAAGWAGGYFDGPDGRYLFASVAGVVILFAGMVVAVVWVARGFAAADGDPRQGGVFWRRGLIACSAVLILALGISFVLSWAKGS